MIIQSKIETTVWKVTAPDQSAACRLKQQMVVEQEEEEEKLRWRVEAEVQSALRLAATDNEASESQVANLRTELQKAEATISGLQTDLTAWEAAVLERDTELQNLQVGITSIVKCQDNQRGLHSSPLSSNALQD